MNLSQKDKAMLSIVTEYMFTDSLLDMVDFANNYSERNNWEHQEFVYFPKETREKLLPVCKEEIDKSENRTQIKEIIEKIKKMNSSNVKEYVLSLI